MTEMLEILSTLHDMEGAPKNNLENVAKGMFEKGSISSENLLIFFL